MKGDLKVAIWDVEYSFTTGITFYEDLGDGNIGVAEPVDLKFKRYKQNEAIPATPTITISRTMAKQFLQSLAEALSEKGFKTDKDAKIEGTLSATRYHLEDTRTLLGLKGKEKKHGK